MYHPYTKERIRKDARRLDRRIKLPEARGPARFEWSDDSGEEHYIILSKRDRQVLQAIIEGPVYCASPIRLSDSVLRLRRDHGVPIETETFTERDGEVLTFGVYFLTANVRLAPSLVEAA